MADQAITALPKKTYSGSSKIAATDYLLGIDSAEGYQMLIQDLGEYIINKVTASLAGSNQTLAAAISALNSNSYLLKGAQRIANNTNINTITTPGNYQVTFASDATTMTNLPYGTAGILKVEKSGYASDNYVRQIYKLFDTADAVYVRSTVNGGSSWTNWVKEPTRAEINAVSSKQSLTVTIASNNIDPAKSSVSAFKCGNITIITGYFYVTTQLAANSNMFQISGDGYTSPYNVIFAIAGNSDNSISRLKLESNTVKSDDAFSANKYYSFEIVFA